MDSQKPGGVGAALHGNHVLGGQGQVDMSVDAEGGRMHGPDTQPYLGGSGKYRSIGGAEESPKVS